MNSGKGENISFSVFIMNSTLLVCIINFFSLLISVAQLCLASSIFDFIVMNKMYYTSHDETVLVDPEYAVLFFCAPLLSAALSLLTVMIPQTPTSVQLFFAHHPLLTALVHSFILTVSSIGFAMCSFITAQLSIGIGYYAYNGVPAQFQAASFWYFIRLRAAAILFGIQSVFTFAQIALLYMGIECRYKIISPQPKKKTPLTIGSVHSTL